MWTNSQRLIAHIGSWLFLMLTTLIVFRSLSFELFFLLGLIGIIIMAGLICPYLTTPPWKSRLNLLIFIGILAFIALVIEKSIYIINTLFQQ